MMQLSLSPLPAATPTADPGGSATGSAPAAGDGDAASVFASLLTAMQSGESTDTEVADTMLGDGEAVTATDEPVGEGEIPAGLAALVQSLVLPQVAGHEAGTAEGADAPPAQATPLQASPAMATGTEGVGGIAFAGTSPQSAQVDPSAIAASAEPVDGMARGAMTGEPVPTELTGTTTGPAAGTDLRTTTGPAGATELRMAAATAQPTAETDAVTAAADVAVAVDAETDGPALTIANQTGTETGAETETGTAEPSAAGAERRDSGTRHARLAQDGGESSNQVAPAATPLGEARADQAPAAVDGRRATIAERPGVGSAPATDATVHAPTAAVTETAAPGNVERADAPLTIERITLREMPTVIVDRIRAIDPQGGVNRAVVRLDPPELGRIMLEVVSNGDEIAVIARADSAEAVRALVRQRTEIEAAMEALGLSVSDFDVRQGDSEPRDADAEGRNDATHDERRPAADTSYTTIDSPATEGELFL